MSLMEHLEELRARLLKVTIVALILGGVSLAFAKPIFGLLMRPVLDALPADNRALIYTSGIEEINVLMKVGLYAGIFLTTPVILWQIWQFVAPGLYDTEKRLAAPFVILGTLAFVAGALFCYFFLLPTMFQFLLREGDSAALEQRIDTGRMQEADALRYLSLGEAEKAGAIAKAAGGGLAAEGDGQADGQQVVVPQVSVELLARLEGMGRLIDSARSGFAPSGRAVLKQALDKRVEAVAAYGKADFVKASQSLEDAASLLSGVSPQNASDFGDLWKLEKDLANGKSRYEAQSWTKPMLTMKEQLSLVLVLELAFGVIFELPLVMALLALVGLVKSKWLMKYQRHAFVFCLIAAAVITPTGDAVNLAMMAGPMLMCFEVGVLAVWMIERRRGKEDASSAITPTKG
ncbi:MAG: twin-arginine translocase subunit TatC [Myxococcaceae bacterium]